MATYEHFLLMVLSNLGAAGNGRKEKVYPVEDILRRVKDERRLAKMPTSLRSAPLVYKALDVLEQDGRIEFLDIDYEPGVLLTAHFIEELCSAILEYPQQVQRRSHARMATHRQSISQNTIGANRSRDVARLGAFLKGWLVRQAGVKKEVREADEETLVGLSGTHSDENNAPLSSEQCRKLEAILPEHVLSSRSKLSNGRLPATLTSPINAPTTWMHKAESATTCASLLPSNSQSQSQVIVQPSLYDILSSDSDSGSNTSSVARSSSASYSSLSSSPSFSSAESETRFGDDESEYRRTMRRSYSSSATLATKAASTSEPFSKVGKEATCEAEDDRLSVMSGSSSTKVPYGREDEYMSDNNSLESFCTRRSHRHSRVRSTPRECIRFTVNVEFACPCSDASHSDPEPSFVINCYPTRAHGPGVVRTAPRVTVRKTEIRPAHCCGSCSLSCGRESEHFLQARSLRSHYPTSSNCDSRRHRPYGKAPVQCQRETESDS